MRMQEQAREMEISINELLVIPMGVTFLGLGNSLGLGTSLGISLNLGTSLTFLTILISSSKGNSSSPGPISGISLRTY
jgi:hypothetical protein